MLIVGAKGFAKEVLEVFLRLKKGEDVVFYDDVNDDIGDLLYGRFPILKNEDQATFYFLENGSKFSIGIGNPHLRHKLYIKFSAIGGELTSIISPEASIGSFDIVIGDGCNVLNNVIFSNSTSIGKGCIVYYNVTITHDCIVGDFVELSPGATLLGGCHIGSFSTIGSNATILPRVKIGKNVIIGAGAVVNRNVPDNCIAVGVPAKVIKHL